MTRTAAALAALAVCVVFAVSAAEAATHGLITGDGVHVRSGEAKAYRAIGKLNKGEWVQIVSASKDGQWVRIAPPAAADVWIFAKYVAVDGASGVVSGDKVRVRARPDLKGELVNRLNKGTALTVRGRKGDWLRIAPPSGTVAWVHTRYVKRMTDAELAAHRRQEAAEEAKAKAEEERKRAEAELARTREEEAKRKAAAELARKEAEEAARREAEAVKTAQGKSVEGWVAYIGPGLERSGATHRITKNGEVLALLRSTRVDLDAFIGTRVRVTGRADGAPDGVVEVGAVRVVLD